MSLQSDLTAFLQKHHDPLRPLLLGFSGGPDSLALLHLLIEYKKRFPLDLHVAHLDHGWRNESADEAQQFGKMVSALSIPYHTARIPKERLTGNLEEASRQERIRFFEKLIQQHPFQAILLGHHADDQAETVLKRVLEGKSLLSLGGIKPIQCLGELTLWRPLLPFTKKEIGEWLNERGLQGIYDSSNDDQRFLRNKMRKSIIPQLSEDFGKMISPSLSRLGEEAADLQDYMQSNLLKYEKNIHKGKLGLYLDLSKDMPTHRFELRSLLRHFGLQCECFWASEVVKTMEKLLMENAADKEIWQDHKKIYIDRRRLFVPIAALPQLIENPKLLSPDLKHFGPWKIITVNSSELAKWPTWHDIWKGEFVVCLPENEKMHLGCYHNDYNKKLSNGKIPSFLKYSTPFLWKNDAIFADFLLGKKCIEKASQSTIEYRFSYSN